MFYSQTKNRHKRWYHILRVGHRKLWAIGIAAAALLVACLAVLVVYSVRAAAYDIKLVGKSLHGSALYDSQQRLLDMLTAHEDAPVAWDELPEHLINAFVAREDSHFFDHGGVVYSSFVRSLLRNVSAMRYAQGGSTITMQLTRHVFELQGKTLDRKLLEIALTQRVESNYDKRTILCQYLSRIYFGQSCYGLREAASYYFGKQVSELSLAESAMLAGVVRAPSLYNPKRSLETAHKVRRETLQRMLELEMISQEQYDQADATPIELAPPHSQLSSGTAGTTSPAMWANAELETLPEVQDEPGQGMSVVSTINIGLQRYLEEAVKNTLAAVENSPGVMPETWRQIEGAEALADIFAKSRRPEWLRPPGATLKPGEGRLQCCAMIIDSRRNHRGELLAVVSARDTARQTDLWQGRVKPGRTIAPLVFCCACLPGGNSHYIVSKSAEVTASRLGYGVVRSFFDSLKLDAELPDQEHENDLYNGLFLMKRVELARVLFDLQNMGKGYGLRLISTVWSQGQRLLYKYEPDEAPEYIRRESAVAVAHLPPFNYREGSPTILHEKLPEDGGYWCMVFNDRGVAVILWLGLEGEQLPPIPRDLHTLMSHASLLMAKDLHTTTRRELRTAAPSTP